MYNTRDGEEEGSLSLFLSLSVCGRSVAGYVETQAIKKI